MRTTMIDGERFYVYQDVCRSLGLPRADMRAALRVPPENRRSAQFPVQVNQRFMVLNESGVRAICAALEKEVPALGAEEVAPEMFVDDATAQWEISATEV